MAPLCSCGWDIVIYVCQEPECHNNDDKLILYCSNCLEDGELHTEHKLYRGHLRILNVMKTIQN